MRRRRSGGGHISPSAPCIAVRRDDLAPLCPYCEAELAEIYMRKPRRFGVGRGLVFFCPHCRKVLGVGAQWYPLPG